MKKLLCLAIAIILVGPMASRADDSSPIRVGEVIVQHDDMDSLKISFTTGELTFGKVTLGGNGFATLSLDGYMPSTHAGFPDLPTFSQLIEVPLCSGFEVRVSDAVYDTVDAPKLPIVPVQPPRRKSDTSVHPLVMDAAVYATDVFYQEPAALVEAIGIARDRNLARLQFSPVSYNPVANKLVVCRQATVTVVYRDADVSATTEMFDRYHSPAFAPATGALNNLYPKSVSSSAPVRYLIVAHSMFRGQMNAFVEWKRRKGFLVDVVYTGDAAVGTTATSIATYIKSQYTNATAENPAPVYLLLVGDVAQIPAHTGVSDDDHVTDLYYTTWTTGDNVPDCYHGRFSAQNLSQLTPQIEKTLMYEQYTFADPTFLDRAVMVSGVDAGNPGDNAYTYGDPSMDYAVTNYINGGRGFQQVRYFKNDVSIVPVATNVVMGSSAGSNAALVRNCYNEGAGLINYTAHGSPSCWGTPYFGTDNVPSMTNSQKFGLMIGNCCQSNTFTEDACLGEALLRRDDYCGAVGYIGGSNSTYWSYDFYWTVGGRSGVGPTMSMAYNSANTGAYDHLCHTHNEPYFQWAITQGGLMMAGNMAVTAYVGNGALYYWEIYHLMGDPSVMTYLTQAQSINLTVQPVIVSGTTTLQVGAVPYAYVAVTDSVTHTLVASAFANASGNVTLALPATLPVGAYEVTASAQQYRTAFRDLNVIAPTQGEACPIVSNLVATAALEAGSSISFYLSVKNIGDAAASDVVVRLSSANPYVTFSTDSVVVQNVAAGETVSVSISVTLGEPIADGTNAIIKASAEWNGTASVNVNFPIQVSAPALRVSYSPTALTILPGSSGQFEATIINEGHAALPSSRLKVLSPTSLLTVATADTAALSIAPGTSVTLHYSLQAASQLPQNIAVPLYVHMDGFYNNIDDTLRVFSSAAVTETFEGGAFHIIGWVQGIKPWSFTSAEADGGQWSLRSNSNMDHNDTSEITLTYIVTQPDSIRFRYRVSSEDGYDKFRFYIDGNEKLSASGQGSWTSAAVPVSAGSHVFKFAYEKDYSVSRYSDCAWIDNIVLPPAITPVVFQTDTTCAGSLYVLGDDTIVTSAPTTGTHVLNDAGGVTMVDYVILPLRHIDTAVVACDSLLYDGHLYQVTSLIEYSSVSQESCDSVALHLVVNHSVFDTVQMTVTGDSYLWGDTLCTASGEYRYHATTIDGCDSVVTLVLTLEPDTVGIVEVESNVVKVYPNPTAGIVRFSGEVAEAVLYDASGRVVARREKASSVDLTSMPAGTYLLQLQLPTGSASCRVVKR